MYDLRQVLTELEEAELREEREKLAAENKNAEENPFALDIIRPGNQKKLIINALLLVFNLLVIIPFWYSSLSCQVISHGSHLYQVKMTMARPIYVYWRVHVSQNGIIRYFPFQISLHFFYQTRFCLRQNDAVYFLLLLMFVCLIFVVWVGGREENE